MESPRKDLGRQWPGYQCRCLPCLDTLSVTDGSGDRAGSGILLYAARRVGCTGLRTVWQISEYSVGLLIHLYALIKDN